MVRHITAQQPMVREGVHGSRVGREKDRLTIFGKLYQCLPDVAEITFIVCIFCPVDRHQDKVFALEIVFVEDLGSIHLFLDVYGNTRGRWFKVNFL